MTTDMSLDQLGAEESGVPLVGLAMALTGDRPSAATLLAHARSRSRRSALTVRDVVAEAARRRRARLDRPVRDGLPTELDLVAVALDRLTPLQRTALVATRLSRLTYAETASVLDRSAAVVTRAVAEAGAAVGDDPYAIGAALEQLSWQGPTGAEQATADRAVARRRRRRRRTLGAAAAAALVVLVASAVVPLLGPEPPAYARRAGEWTYGLGLTSPPGWTTTSHLLNRTAEIITVTPGAVGACRMTAELAASSGTVPVRSGDNPFRSVRINGRSGVYSSTGGGRLTWPLGGGAVGVISCTGTTDNRETALTLARHLRPEATVLRLPFRLTDVPLGTRLGWVGQRDGHLSVSIVSTTGVNIDTEAVSISVYQVSYGTSLDHDPSRTWDIATTDDGVSACQTVEHRQFCVVDPTVGSNGMAMGSGAAYGLLFRIVEAIKVVGAVGDESHWLDASEALPQ